MNADETFAALERYDGSLPRAALRSAAECREAIVPMLLREVKRATDDLGRIRDDANYMRHVYALYLLAQFRETKAFPLIVELFSLPGDVVDEVFGDLVTEDLGRILASTFDGGTARLEKMIESDGVYTYARSAALQAFVILWGRGRLTRREVIGYFRSLMSGKLTEEASRRRATDSAPTGRTMASQGRGQSVASLARPASRFCPVAALDDWLGAVGIAEGASFRKALRGGTVGPAGLNPSNGTDIVKRAAREAGPDASRYSARSLRHGPLTSAAHLDGANAFFGCASTRDTGVSRRCSATSRTATGSSVTRARGYSTSRHPHRDGSGATDSVRPATPQRPAVGPRRREATSTPPTIELAAGNAPGQGLVPFAGPFPPSARTPRTRPAQP